MNTTHNIRSIEYLLYCVFAVGIFWVSVPSTQAQTRQPRSPRVWTGRCDPMKQEQTDLTGTYRGKFTIPHEGIRAKDGVFTINGNNYTLTVGSETWSGRITAVTTCGYTAVTLMAGDLTPPTPSPNPPPALPAISLRAKKTGNRLTLIGVEGEKKQILFQCPCKCGYPCDCCS